MSIIYFENDPTGTPITEDLMVPDSKRLVLLGSTVIDATLTIYGEVVVI